MNVERTIEVACDPAAAFEHFTTRIGAWWPLRDGFSFAADRCDSIHLEARVGGRFFERLVDGDELLVGTVSACEPPHRIVFTWAPPVWPAPTEVEVRFLDDGDDTTTVRVEHRGFAALGDLGPEVHDGFANGWPRVLAAYARSATA